MGISVTGVQRTLQAQRGMVAKDAKNIAISLSTCAQVLLKASQKLVPVDTGALKASGKVDTTGNGFAAVATVSYDGPYAIFVHEKLEAYHEPPTQARYLADAVPKVRGTMTNILKRQLAVGQ